MRLIPPTVSRKKIIVLFSLLIASLALHFQSASITTYIIGTLYTFGAFLLLYFAIQSQPSRRKDFGAYAGIALLFLQLLFVFSLNYTRDFHFVRNFFTKECHKKSTQYVRWYEKEDPVCRPDIKGLGIPQ